MLFLFLTQIAQIAQIFFAARSVWEQKPKKHFYEKVTLVRVLTPLVIRMLVNKLPAILTNNTVTLAGLFLVKAKTTV